MDFTYIFQKVHYHSNIHVIWHIVLYNNYGILLCPFSGKQFHPPPGRRVQMVQQSELVVMIDQD